MNIDLTKEIQYYSLMRKKWLDFKITNISIGPSYTEDVPYGITVTGNILESDSTISIHDFFNQPDTVLRYKETCCEQCLYHSVEGGDAVPYGSGTAYTPEGIVCELDIDLDVVEEGRNCPYFKRG